METPSKHHVHEAAVPSSPALTNPDMILPYLSHSRDSTPLPIDRIPSLTQLDHQAGKDEMLSTETTPKGSYVGKAQNTSRPSLPGAWLTEEDIHGPVQQADNREPSPNLTQTSLPEEPDFGTETNQYDEDDEGPYKEPYNNKDGGDGRIPRRSTVDSLEDGDDHPKTAPFGRSNLARAVLEEDENDPTSHAALSLRAEEILANAKKRLTDMEDNLSRARRSLSATPSISRSSPMNKISRLSPRQTAGRNEDNWYLSAAKHRQLSHATSPGSGGGHSRVFSETSIPSPMPSLLTEKARELQRRRASSAMGAVGSNPNQQRNNGPGTPEGLDDDGLTSFINRSSSLASRQNRHLEPLREDEPALTLADTLSPCDSPPSTNESQLYRRFTSAGSAGPHSGSRANGRELTRARSNIQLRDLREQMHDLRDKVTSLKQRTRQDSLQRRSLQTLKTPSPFTVAKDWANGDSYFNPSPLSTDAGSDPAAHGPHSRGFSPLMSSPTPRSGEQLVKVKEEDETEEPYRDTNLDGDSLDQAQQDGEDDDQADDVEDFHSTLPGDEDFVEVEENDSEQVYQIREERHEDRADAFDFQHVFLYSGNSTSRRSDSRRNSQSSRESVETTKPDVAHIDEKHDDAKSTHEQKNSAHSRQNSKDSISTAATFATATEGNGSVHGGQEADEWSYNPASQAWQHEARPGSQQSVGDRGSRSKDRRVQNGTYLEAPLHPQKQARMPRTKGTKSSAMAEEQTPISVLLSSISSPKHGSTTSRICLGKIDEDLVQRLLGSVQVACRNLDEGKNQGSYERKIWRRRLDMARRVLEGEFEEDSE